MSLPMISVTDGDLPAWPETRPDDDPMLAARGVVYTMGLSLPFWLTLALLAWWVMT